MHLLIARLVFDDCGQDLIEFALVTAFISTIALFMVMHVGNGVNRVYTGVGSQVNATPSVVPPTSGS